MSLLPMSLRHAVRRWRHRPGLALTATLVLALGMGATTAMFSIVDAVLLRAEPWPEADRLVRIHGVLLQQRSNPASAATWDRGGISWASWRDLQKLPVFDDVAVWVADRQVVGEHRTELVRSFYASSTLLTLVGVMPARGRFFTAEEEEADSNVAVISHRLWTRLFGGDPDVVGKTTMVTPPGSTATESRRRTIVGVLPETFTFPGDEPDLFVPIGFHKYNGSFGNPFFLAMGRLTPGMSVGAATDAAEPLVRREEPSDRRSARVVTLRMDRVGVGDRSLWLLLAGAGLLLIVACSNVAGLLLSDARTRHHETAVRLALGGTRWAIVRQLALEHGLLAVGAAAGGVLLAVWLIPSLTVLAPPGLIGDQTVALNAQIAGWSIAAAVVTTFLAGLIPAAAVSSTKPGVVLKGGSREATRGGRWRHRAIVAAQFALTLVLLVGAGLFGETLLRLGDRPLGFSPEGVVVASVLPGRPGPVARATPEERAHALELRRTGNMAAYSAFVAQRGWVRVQSLLDRLAAQPGVMAVATADTAPFSQGIAPTSRLRAAEQPVEQAFLVQYRFVSEQYFQVMGIPILRGRGFAPADRVTRPVVISAGLERHLFGQNAVGRQVNWFGEVVNVIGVVADVQDRVVTEDAPHMVYTNSGQAERVRNILIRTAGAPAAFVPSMRQAIEGHDSPMFVTSASPLDDLVAATMAIERGRAMLSGVYGGVALLLASVGLYGLAARLVAERRREIGIRVALGAGPRDVRRLVMSDAWLIVGLGVVVGVPAAIVASNLAQGMLYGVAPAAPHVMGVAAIALATAAILATAVPAVRANRIDPATTLREE
jgi:hypothetical protein